MNIYDGIEEVQPARKKSQGETVWIAPGRYELEVVRVADGRADQGEGRPYFVVEFDVLESNNPEIPKGETISWMTMRGKFKQYFLQDVQNFIAAATGSSAQEVTPDVVATCTSEDQPLVGTVVSASAYNKPSQSTGRDFTVVTYETRRDN
jgi:hypothetical protein